MQDKGHNVLFQPRCPLDGSVREDLGNEPLRLFIILYEDCPTVPILFKTVHNSMVFFHCNRQCSQIQFLSFLTISDVLSWEILVTTSLYLRVSTDPEDVPVEVDLKSIVWRSMGVCQNKSL
jgi:hypothetical protein